METFTILLLIGLCILFLILFTKEKRKNNLLKQNKKNLINKEFQTELKKTQEEYERKFAEEKQKFNKKTEELNKILETQEKQKNLFVRQGQEIVDKEIENYRLLEMSKARSDFNQRAKEIDNEYQKLKDDLEKFKFETSLEKNTILKELEEFQKQRRAINEEIRREEELQNGIDSHRILLKETEKEDIKFLLSIEEKIHNKEILHKLIWADYLQKPFNQMLKNLFGAQIPKNVIYCIENINTQKKYIGKTSSEVTKRWTEHIKSSLNIGTISHQSIHDAMFAHWDEFIFSILEETEKDLLNEKEKYYISFFESDKYGYNLKK